MKILICLFLCALVATTYAAPKPLRPRPPILNGISFEDDDNVDDDLATIEALLIQGLQDRAQIEGDVLKKIAKGALKLGPKAIRVLGHGAEGALDLVPHAINALGGGVEVQDADGDDIANIEAFLSSVQNADDKAQVNAMLKSLQLQDKAKAENFLKTLGKIGKGILSVFGKKK